MKDIFVILGFHAHEPIWDMTQRLLDWIDDPRLKGTFPADNWILKRAEAGRDVYCDLLDFSRDLNVPVALEATNEVLEQIAEHMPATFAALAAGYRAGRIAPVYGHAYHTHIALLTDSDVEEEIALNRDFIHNIMGAPRPVRLGLFPSEDSLDSRKLGGIEAAGIDYVLFPNLSPRKARYHVMGNPDVVYRPFRIGRGLTAIARHFPVSQYIWRAVTRYNPAGVRSQGFLMGKFFVFEEEYRQRAHLSYPLSWEQAVADYRSILETALRDAPDRGVVLYTQDLELMDFGDVALAIMQEAWRQVLDAAYDLRVHFVRPDEYVQEQVVPQTKRLARVQFDQVSWAPEARLLLRADGHYPPLDAGPFRGMDAGTELFARRPFIFWDTGRPLVDIMQTLVEGLGYDTSLGVTAAELHAAGNRFSQLFGPQQVAYHLRIMKRACNWGWQPDETRQKWPYLHAWCICALMLDDLATGNASGAGFTGVSPSTLTALSRLPEVFIDTRVAYLEAGLTRQFSRAPSVREGFTELNRTRGHREAATAALVRAHEHNAGLERAANDRPAALTGLLTELQEHCARMVLATEHIQRAWGRAADTGELVTSMYEYLYELYPPLFPQILDELEEAERGVQLAHTSEPEAEGEVA